jgi:MoaD family protein
VKVKPFGALRYLAENTILEVELKERSTVHDLIEELEREHGGFREATLNPHVTIFVNGREIDFMKGLKTELVDRDLIVLLPPVAGG